MRRNPSKSSGPQLPVPPRPMIAIAVLVLAAVATLGVLGIGLLTRDWTRGLFVAALLLALLSLAGLLLFKVYHLPLEQAQYLLDDQSYQLTRQQEKAAAPVTGRDPALAAARKENDLLGQQLAEAHAAIDDLRRQAETLAAQSGAAKAASEPHDVDVPTGLRYGCAAFEQGIASLIDEAKSSGSFHGVLVAGLDGLDRILDQSGPANADEYIWSVAQIVVDGAGRRDDVYRLSAKHFGVLLPGVGERGALATAQKMVTAVAAREFSWNGQTLAGSVSVGVLTLGLSDDSAQEVVERAVHAQARAQAEGGDRVHVEATLQMLDRRTRDRSLREWLENRLDRGQQRLAAQAIVPLGTPAAEATWHEVLLRIEDDDGVWLPPEHYLDTLERLQMTARVDRWVIGQALKRRPSGDPARAARRRVSINVFGASLARGSFLAELRDLLAGSAWPTGQICFEIDEATVLQSPSRVSGFIEAASEFGCQFALDRYRGIAGLAALRNIPVQYVKLHESLIARRSTDPIDQAQLEWLIRSARLTGARVVAVGVRDEDCLARVRELKVDFVQGFAVAPPSPWTG